MKKLAEGALAFFSIEKDFETASKAHNLRYEKMKMLSDFIAAFVRIVFIFSLSVYLWLKIENLSGWTAFGYIAIMIAISAVGIALTYRFVIYMFSSMSLANLVASHAADNKSEGRNKWVMLFMALYLFAAALAAILFLAIEISAKLYRFN